MLGKVIKDGSILLRSGKQKKQKGELIYEKTYPQEVA